MRFITTNSGKYNGAAQVLVGVLHHTAGGLESALATLFGGAQVSIQYLIAPNGDIWYDVPLGKRAWHCGLSDWNGQQDWWGSVNGISFGVELVNRGDGADPFTKEQLDSLDWLLVHHAAPEVGETPLTRHRDISWEGKIDPAGNFPWHNYSGGIEQVRKRVKSKDWEVEMADIEDINLNPARAKHPGDVESWAKFIDEGLENNWLFVGYPHYAPGVIGDDGNPQPDTILCFAYVTDMNGNIHWQEVVTLGKGADNGKDHFYHVWKLPELGQGRVQVDYEKPGLGDLPYMRRIRVK